MCCSTSKDESHLEVERLERQELSESASSREGVRRAAWAAAKAAATTKERSQMRLQLVLPQLSRMLMSMLITNGILFLNDTFEWLFQAGEWQLLVDIAIIPNNGSPQNTYPGAKAKGRPPRTRAQGPDTAPVTLVEYGGLWMSLFCAVGNGNWIGAW
jgi:hypothetical protein